MSPARRTMCESHFNVQVALYVSHMWPLRLALYFCESHFTFESRTLFFRMHLSFCESHLTFASRKWLLRVALDFYKAHMTSASRTLCERHFIVRVTFYASRIPDVRVALCASRTILYESHYVRVALLKCFPLSTSPPLPDKSIGVAANIHRRLDLMMLLIIA